MTEREKKRERLAFLLRDLQIGTERTISLPDGPEFEKECARLGEIRKEILRVACDE